MTEIPSQGASAPLPPLRPEIEAVEVEHDGQPLVLLRDQEGLSKQAIAVSLPGFLVAGLMNGERTAAEIRGLFLKKTGAVLSEEEIVSLSRQLADAGLLETEELRRERERVVRAFRDSSVRPAHVTSYGYPQDAIGLAAYLGKFFKDPNGPGKEAKGAASAAGASALGLVVPHIDLERGGPAYAWAYQALSETPPPDVIVAFGTAHMAPDSPWIPTRKEYECIYGRMAVDNALYEAFRKILWYDPAADEWAHRTEHSLEFQALWLKYLWRDAAPPWLPVLVSSFDRFAPETAPSSIETIETAIRAMGDVLAAMKKDGRRILVLAGVDLAHVGPRFGDPIEPTPEVRAKIEAEDRESIDHALRLDADAFYASAVRDGHWRKVCGLSPLYMALRMMARLADGTPSGRRLTYAQADDPMGGVVSFASLIFQSS